MGCLAADEIDGEGTGDAKRAVESRRGLPLASIEGDPERAPVTGTGVVERPYRDEGPSPLSGAGECDILPTNCLVV